MIVLPLRFAFRRLAREWGYTAIHVVGLATGVAACLLILLYLQHERGYDRFHPGSDRTVQLVLENQSFGEFGRSLPGHVAADLAERMPEVEAAAAFESDTDDMLVSVGGEREFVAGFASATPGFFDVFGGFETLAGNPSQALNAPGGAVLTRTLAERWFGSPEASLGQTLETLDETLLDREQFETESRMSFEPRGAVPYTVRAVVADPPTASSVRFALLVPRVDTGFRGWNVSQAETFLRLRPGADLEALEAKLADYVARDAVLYGGGASHAVTETILHAQPLTDVHLHPDLGAAEGTGPGQYLALFAAAALLVLLLASINYVNLATARAVRRAREVGVRKTVGASRAQLWAQFLVEAGVVVAAAVALGVALAALALGPFEATLGVDLSLRSLATPLGVAVLAGLFAAVTLASGTFPAAVLARFRPAVVLKGVPTPSGSGRWLRRGLVVFQFGASVALVLAMLGVGRQMAFVREARLGGLDSQVVVIDNEARGLAGGYADVKATLLARPSIAAVTTGTPPSGSTSLLFQPLREGGNPVPLTLAWAGADYLETLGLTLVEGSGLDAPPPSADSPVLVNEAAVRASDLAALASPVGVLDTRFNGGDVVGVVQDFHFESFHAPIGPLVILPSEGVQEQILVRVRAGQTAAGLAEIQRAWQDAVPDRPLQYAFLDEALDARYQTELRMSRLFQAFAALAILIAALGLFGLASYTAEGRAKEVGIRKVLGASTAGLVGRLSREFVALVAVGFALSAPLAYVALERWLGLFAYHIEPGAGLVALTGAVVLAVALVAVGGQAIRAATADPVRALRSE